MKRIIYLAVAGLLAAACAREPVFEADLQADRQEAIFGAEVPEEDLIPDEMNVLVNEETAAILEAATGEDGYVEMSRVKAFSDLGVVKMRRLFPYAGKFEPRTRAEGMHLWYVVTRSGDSPMTKAAGSVLALPGVDVVELKPQIHIVGDPVVTGYAPAAAPETKAGSGVRYPFNDPRLPSQWHYYNDGTVSASESGCDINVFSVWRAYATGNPKVIVSVVDEGVDYTHEDLAPNMWTNPEKSGDMRYGYNFVNNTFKVNPGDHGTHVAGTISAVNNNGKGVCGIAGGDAAASEKGVKIMSCQIFEGKQSADGGSAIKWGADHGAVISQNSWGYVNVQNHETPLSLRNAVDYFIKYAGVDENGKQTGPMKGGVVIFAAGNENREISGNGYGPIINVASVGANYRKAYYSCYGSWVDIAAPGGDARGGNQVLSTLPGNKYGYMQGTSMACPHVSGVAALILSKFGGSGYTADGLTKKLLNNTTNISSFNPNFKIGVGLVNAYKAIAPAGGKAPKTPTDMSIRQEDIKANNVKFSITVPVDEDDEVPTAIVFYYSKSDFTKISDNLQYAKMYVGALNAGDTMEGIFTGMEFDADYFVAAAAEDALGNHSNITQRVKIHTGPNSKPVITALNTPSTSIKPYETFSYDYDVVDPDGHYYSLELEAKAGHPVLDGKGEVVAPKVVLDTTVRNKPKVLVEGKDLATDTYTATLTITDYFGAVSTVNMAFEILANNKPYAGETMPSLVFSSRAAETQTIDCDKYFKDDDGEQLTYSMEFSNETVVNMTSEGGKFLLTPMNYGYCDITVTGTDVRGESVSQTFTVLVRDGSKEVDVYPNPVSTDLYVRGGSDMSVEVSVISSSGATFFHESKDITPFNPVVIDMRKAFPGVYTVIVVKDGKTVKNNVVKI